MPKITNTRARQLQQIRTEMSPVPTDQIISVMGRNPYAEGLGVLGQALERRAALRRQGEELAQMETLAGVAPGSYKNMSTPIATEYAKTRMKAVAEAEALAKGKLEETAKIRGLEKLFGLPEGKLGDNYDNAKLRVSQLQMGERQKQAGANRTTFQGFDAQNRPVAFNPGTNTMLPVNVAGGIQPGPLTPRTDPNSIKAARDLDQYASDAKQALVALDKIEKAATNLGDFGRGAIPQAYGRATTAYKEFAKEEDMTRYLGVVSQELIPMARKLMEEKGPITESDVVRVESGLGAKTTPLADKMFLINELRDKVREAVAGKANIAGMDMGTFSSKYPGLTEKLSKLPSPNGQTNGGDTITIKASDGSMHTLPRVNLEKAKQRDPGLQVVQ